MMGPPHWPLLREIAESFLPPVNLIGEGAGERDAIATMPAQALTLLFSFQILLIRIFFLKFKKLLFQSAV